MNRKKNRMVWSGMPALALVFAVLVLAAGLSACDSPDDFPRGREGEKEPGDTKAPGFDMSEIGDYLSKATGGGGTTNPVPLPVSLDLPSDWLPLLEAIHTAGKYVALDLSACTMSGTKEFDPTGGSSGKDKIVSLVLPDAATSIKAGYYGAPTFKNFSSLTSVSGDNIETVDSWVFSDCDNLASVSLPKATYIGSAFFDCTNLATVSLPKATTIGTSAFSDCTNLASVSLPKATDIGRDAFIDCTNLATVSLPEATDIGEHAFYRCANLATVSLPEATDIGNNAFYLCTKLETVNLPEATTIGYKAFSHCAQLASVNLPAATDIGDHAFAYCDNLASVSLPKATDIGSAFIGCTNLATVSLPKATTIGGHAFSQTGNTDLTVTLGSTVPALGDAMFSDVTDAKTVTVKVPNVAAWTNITGNYAETSNYTVNWGNGFRGGGWTQAGAFVSYGQIKNNITLTVTTIQ